jgi:hypothetical protein
VAINDRRPADNTTTRAVDLSVGPGAVMRYTATVKGDTWREVGEYIAGDKPGVPMFEMNLMRVGDSEWPLGTPIPPSVAKP